MVLEGLLMGRGFQDLMLSKIPIDISACKENFLMFISKIYCNLTKLTLKKKKNHTCWEKSRKTEGFGGDVLWVQER